MTCRPGKTARLQNLNRPARVCGVLAGAGLVVVSYFLPRSPTALTIAASGAAVIAVMVLLPLVTEFEFDVLGLRAKTSLKSREQRLQDACRGACRRVASLARLVGVRPEQIEFLVEEAIEDTCRLWRGPVVSELVGRLLVCRTAHLILLSLRLGGPYRVENLTTSRGAAEFAAFASSSPRERLMLALAEWLELDAVTIAEMLDVDALAVERTTRPASAATAKGPTP